MDENLLDDLAERYRSARRKDRSRVLVGYIDLLMELGRAADEESVGLARSRLSQMKGASDFVLKGTLQQQVACKFAIQLGLHLPKKMPPSVRTLAVMPLIDALLEVLRLGAPTTRDTAVEGLGALLKLVDHPESHFPSVEPIAVVPA